MPIPAGSRRALCSPAAPPTAASPTATAPFAPPAPHPAPAPTSSEAAAAPPGLRHVVGVHGRGRFACTGAQGGIECLEASGSCSGSGCGSADCRTDPEILHSPHITALPINGFQAQLRKRRSADTVAVLQGKVRLGRRGGRRWLAAGSAANASLAQRGMRHHATHRPSIATPLGPWGTPCDARGPDGVMGGDQAAGTPEPATAAI